MRGACHGSVLAGHTKTNSDTTPHIFSYSGQRCWCEIDKDHIFRVPLLAVIFFHLCRGEKQDAKNFYRNRPLTHQHALFPCYYFWSLHVDPAISMATSVFADVFIRYECVLLPVTPPSTKELNHFESVAPSFHIHFHEQEATLWNSTFASVAHRYFFPPLTEKTDVWFENVAFWN